jgi:hypothetical protein
MILPRSDFLSEAFCSYQRTLIPVRDREQFESSKKGHNNAGPEREQKAKPQRHRSGVLGRRESGISLDFFPADYIVEAGPDLVHQCFAPSAVR